MNRRKSRELLMQLLFEISINKQGYEETIENFKEHTDVDLTDVDMEYIIDILKGVQENTKGIDEKIEANLINWKLYRLPKIDLAILRLCTYEIIFRDDIPDKVAVNEALELAKKYSDHKSSSFINGVLGKMIKD